MGCSLFLVLGIEYDVLFIPPFSLPGHRHSESNVTATHFLSLLSFGWSGLEKWPSLSVLSACGSCNPAV